VEASLLIRLIDQVSGNAAKVRRSLQGIADAANQFKAGFAGAIREGFSVDNIETATRNAEAALTRARGRLLGAIGTAYALSLPPRLAAEFDQSMKDLEKALDDVPVERVRQLRQFALETSTKLPVSAKEMIDLMSAAAQAGVPTENLEAFATYVAKAAVAFDMAGGEIGDRFAKLANVYKLDQAGIEDLGDASNYLSNKMASRADEITDFVNRAAGAAKIFNLTAVQTAAVGSALVSAGIVPETAARGFTALSTRVLKGGKDIDTAFKAIGLNRKQWLKDVGKDAPAALVKLFDAMSKSKDGMKALVDIVGQDFSDDFAKLVGNPELLAEALGMVADRTRYVGSVTDEAAKQASGAAKRWELLANKLTRLGIVVGDKLLPPLLELADRLGAIVDRVAAWADAHPELAAGLVKAAALMMALSVATRVAAFAFAGLRLSAINLASFFLKFDGSGRNIALGWRLLAGAGWLLRGALVAVEAAVGALAGAFAGLTWPIWATIAAIAAAGFALWKYWDRVSAFAAGFASVFGDLLIGPIQGAVAWVQRFVDASAELLGIDPGTLAAAFRTAFDTIRGLFDLSFYIGRLQAGMSSLGDWLVSFFSPERLTAEAKAGMYAAGRALGEQLIKGVKDFVDANLQVLRDAFHFVVSIDWPEPPGWLKWLMEYAGVAAGELGGLADRTNKGLAPPASPADAGAANRDAGAAVDGILAGMDRVASGARADMDAGGQSVARGGADAAAALIDGANKAAAAIAGAVRGLGASERSLAAAIAGARSGVLHDGAD
jgi:TP901 family phage tail tape measure protein